MTPRTSISPWPTDVKEIEAGDPTMYGQPGYRISLPQVASPENLYMGVQVDPRVKSAFVNYVEVPENMRRQGLGSQMYKKAAEEAELRGLKFTSSPEEVSSSAHATWESFVEQGYAKRVSGKPYEFEWTGSKLQRAVGQKDITYARKMVRSRKLGTLFKTLKTIPK